MNWASPLPFSNLCRNKRSSIPSGRITKVGVKIGELAGVDRDALQFGFEVLVKDTDWESLVLELEFVPRTQRCPKCAYDFRMTDYRPAMSAVRRTGYRVHQRGRARHRLHGDR